VSPVIPAWAQMAGWAALLLGYAGYQLFIHRGGVPSKVFAVTLALLGLTQLIGVSTGGRDVYAPVAHLFGAPAHTVNFKRIGSLSELNEVLLQSKGQVVMLDFYADWCVSCIEMEKLTFSDAQVKAKLDKILLLQVDVTANNAQDKELLKRFNLFGPPGIIFFDAQGQELIDARVIGYQNVEKFLTSLERLGNL
jgi:thiol:disulfide interchange protein DsbD